MIDSMGRLIQKPQIRGSKFLNITPRCTIIYERDSDFESRLHQVTDYLAGT